MKPVKSVLSALLKFDQAQLKTCEPGTFLIGIDEVGRGSLIGPIVAAAACFELPLKPALKRQLLQLNDSKKLTRLVRTELAEILHQHCLFGIGQAELDEVNTLNVHHSSLLAGRRALAHLCERHSHVMMEQVFLMLDGRTLLPDHPKTAQRAVVKGDGLSAAIAAASVIAKNHRDNWVLTVSEQHPGYGWENNMGYGTPIHLKGIEQKGLTPYHRQNFKSCQLALSL